MRFMAGELKILFHATFREITKNREIISKINEDCTVAVILDEMAKEYGNDFTSIIDPSTGNISSEVLVMLNGRGIRKTDISLKDQDVLVFTLPLGGG